MVVNQEKPLHWLSISRDYFNLLTVHCIPCWPEPYNAHNHPPSWISCPHPSHSTCGSCTYPWILLCWILFPVFLCSLNWHQRFFEKHRILISVWHSAVNLYTTSVGFLDGICWSVPVHYGNGKCFTVAPSCLAHATPQNLFMIHLVYLGSRLISVFRSAWG